MSQARLDAKHEKVLKVLLRLPQNKRCANCDTVGPQYAVTNFNIFVCTTCSGVHRQYGHRCKGVSMSTFKPEEIKGLEAGGNLVVLDRFLARWSPSDLPKPTDRNPAKLGQWIEAVFEKKRYYSDTPVHRSSPQSSPAGSRTSEDPPSTPVSEILGERAPRLVVTPASKSPDIRSPTAVTKNAAFTGAPPPSPAADLMSDTLLSFQSPAPQQLPVATTAAAQARMPQAEVHHARVGSNNWAAFEGDTASPSTSNVSPAWAAFEQGAPAAAAAAQPVPAAAAAGPANGSAPHQEPDIVPVAGPPSGGAPSAAAAGEQPASPPVMKELPSDLFSDVMAATGGLRHGYGPPPSPGYGPPRPGFGYGPPQQMYGQPRPPMGYGPPPGYPGGPPPYQMGPLGPGYPGPPPPGHPGPPPPGHPGPPPPGHPGAPPPGHPGAPPPGHPGAPPPGHYPPPGGPPSPGPPFYPMANGGAPNFSSPGAPGPYQRPPGPMPGMPGYPQALPPQMQHPSLSVGINSPQQLPGSSAATPAALPPPAEPDAFSDLVPGLRASLPSFPSAKTASPAPPPGPHGGFNSSGILASPSYQPLSAGMQGFGGGGFSSAPPPSPGFSPAPLAAGVARGGPEFPAPQPPPSPVPGGRSFGGGAPQNPLTKSKGNPFA